MGIDYKKKYLKYKNKYLDAQKGGSGLSMVEDKLSQIEEGINKMSKTFKDRMVEDTYQKNKLETLRRKHQQLQIGVDFLELKMRENKVHHNKRMIGFTRSILVNQQDIKIIKDFLESNYTDFKGWSKEKDEVLAEFDKIAKEDHAEEEPKEEAKEGEEGGAE
tara:strand:+ start:179 stop:664 length:486 start_codon:yes stop_codon:yes gene_type:complete